MPAKSHKHTIITLLSFSLLLGMSHGLAQPEATTPDDLPAVGTQQAGQQEADEEITVIGQRSRRVLRLEVQQARERVYGLFNSLNSNDDFDIHCSSVPRSGTRIPQRVCRPQYADRATRNAGTEFVRSTRSDCFDANQGISILTDDCMATGISRAQSVLTEVPVRDRQLDDEVQRLARENDEFRRAIAGFDVAELRYDESRGVAASGLRVSASVVDSDRAAIPSTLNLQRDEIVIPVPIVLMTPEAPWGNPTAGGAREGWVKLRYSVLADGTTALVRVVDTMPPGLDTAAPVSAARAWTFEPATADGAAIDWNNHLAIVTVNREQTVHDGWLAFANAYEAVAALAADGRYEQAKSSNARMRTEIAATLEEMAFAEMQLAGIEHALGDSYAALDAIRRATESGVRQLEDEQLKVALEHRFALEIELGLAADALSTFERWAVLGNSPSGESMTRLGATLEENLRAAEISLAGQRKISASRHSEHRLTWPVFAVGDVDGRIDSLELVCNRGKAALPFEAEVQMTIPARWGECFLFVEGQADTTFIVYEFQELMN